MRIGVDATCWWNKRGFGRFTRELLKAMLVEAHDHEFCFFVDQAAEPDMLRDNVRVIRVGTARPVTKSATASDNRSLRDIWKFRQAVMAEPLDVMFFPAVYSWFPVGRRVPTIVTLHDAIAEHFPELVFPDRVRRLLWSTKVRLACWQARQIVTVSNAAREEIVEYLGLDRDRIEVICEGADAQFRPVLDPNECREARIRAKLPAEPRLLLYVGGFAPHKNLSRTLNGFAKALEPGDMDDVHFALVGDPAGDGFGTNYGDLVAQVAGDPRLNGRVHFTGFVSDSDLAALYSDSLATVLPSVSEGFGLPALESMACGTPVLTGNAGAAPEVAGDAGLQFDPTSPDQIAAAIRRLATDPDTRTVLEQNALRRAKVYSWARAASLTLAVLEARGKPG